MPRVAERLTNKSIGAYSPDSLSAHLRQRRWERFARTFPDLADMHVLDVGGDARSWRLAGLRPAHVTLLNVRKQHVAEDWMSAVAGDACDMPPDLPAVDVVYSNSVIEHVGGHWRRQRFAAGVRGASDRYWVQTPYRYFPVEPHFLAPGLQHLPRAVQAQVVMRWPIGNYAGVKDRETALRRLMGIELLSRTELAAYFPSATIERESFLGLTKSLIAVAR
jgi:hypothetical protein